MNAVELRDWCLEQTDAVEEFPFGPEHSVFKVRGRSSTATRPEPRSSGDR